MSEAHLYLKSFKIILTFFLSFNEEMKRVQWWAHTEVGCLKKVKNYKNSKSLNVLENYIFIVRMF